jgi:hypothetical protein
VKNNISASPYSEAFYTHQIKSSFLAAIEYALILETYYQPTSVIDFGCGRGSWLKAFGQVFRIHDLTGVDGEWNSGRKLIDDSISFIPLNLSSEKLLPKEKKYDLSMSLEVAEHLPFDCSRNFIELLTSCSDTVIFGAAITLQGGINHINEQFPSYWAKLFMSVDYYPFDIFREKLWHKSNIPFWYKQNTFLYLKKDSSLFSKFLDLGIQPMKNIEFMNAIHPDFYMRRSKPIRSSFDSFSRFIPPSLMLLIYNAKNKVLNQ